MKKIYISLLCCLVSSTLFAAIPPGQWQCMAYDSQENSYDALGMNMQQAMQAASVRCKKESARHGTCKTAQSFCEQGPLSLDDSRCLVTDETGHSWNTNGPDACKTALELCNKWQYLHGIASQCSVKHG